MPDLNPAPVDEAVWHTVPAGSRRAIVAFSGWDVQPGRFNFFGLRRELPEVTQILVRDPARSWYNAGLPGVGDTVERIADGIRAKVDELGAREAITIGSSMGGYAAILFGCLIGAKRAISLVPQTLLHPDLPIAPPPDLDLQAPDLIPITRAAPATRIDLVVGWDSLSDVFHAQRLAGSPSVRVLGVPGDHSFAKRLKGAGDYWPFIVELIEGRTPPTCEAKSPFDPYAIARIEDTVFAKRREDWETAQERIAPLAERYPDWIAPNLWLGEALAGMEDWEGAEVVLARVVRANPHLDRPREGLIRALRERGRPDRAESLIRDALARDPRWWRGHMALEDCLLDMGREAEARAAALHLERSVRRGLADHPAASRGYLMLAQLLVRQGRTAEARAATRRAIELSPALAETRIARDLLDDLMI